MTYSIYVKKDRGSVLVKLRTRLNNVLWCSKGLYSRFSEKKRRLSFTKPQKNPEPVSLFHGSLKSIIYMKWNLMPIDLEYISTKFISLSKLFHY